MLLFSDVVGAKNCEGSQLVWTCCEGGPRFRWCLGVLLQGWHAYFYAHLYDNFTTINAFLVWTDPWRRGMWLYPTTFSRFHFLGRTRARQKALHCGRTKAWRDLAASVQGCVELAEECGRYFATRCTKAWYSQIKRTLFALYIFVCYCKCKRIPLMITQLRTLINA